MNANQTKPNLCCLQISYNQRSMSDATVKDKQTTDSGFVKPSALPIKRKRACESDASAIDKDQPPSSSFRDEKRETLDVFSCIGVLYYTRQHCKELGEVYSELNGFTDNSKDSDFTVNIAKMIAQKINNPVMNKLVSVWEEMETLVKKMLEAYLDAIPLVKKASDRYMSAVTCFLSIWETKNKFLDYLRNCLESLFTIIKNDPSDRRIPQALNKVIEAFALEDLVSSQIISQQPVLIQLTLHLILTTQQMTPHGNLLGEWQILRNTQNQVKRFLILLNVDFEKEMEEARKICGGDTSLNNTAKEVCMMVRRWQIAFDVLLNNTVQNFITSSRGELSVDDLFSKYLAYRITKRERCPDAVLMILKYLCQRGTGDCFPEFQKTFSFVIESLNLKTTMMHFQTQSSRWDSLEAVKFAKTTNYNSTLWGQANRLIKEKQQAADKKEVNEKKTIDLKDLLYS